MDDGIEEMVKGVGQFSQNNPAGKTNTPHQNAPAPPPLESAPPSNGEEVARRYRDEIMRELGNPSSFVARMLVEQLVSAYLLLMKQYAWCFASSTPEFVGLHMGSIVKLTAIIHQTLLALKEYLAPQNKSVATRIRQPSIAESEVKSRGPDASANPGGSRHEKKRADGKTRSD